MQIRLHIKKIISKRIVPILITVYYSENLPSKDT
jgi:hypothetical protein